MLEVVSIDNLKKQILLYLSNLTFTLFFITSFIFHIKYIIAIIYNI